MQLDGYLGALGQLPSYDQLRANGLAMQQAQQGLQAGAQDLQIGQRKLAAYDAQQVEDQAFKDGIVALGGNPTPTQYRQLATRFPGHVKELGEAASALEGDLRQQTVRDTAQIRATISAKKPEIGAAIVQRHIDADKAAGRQADPEDEALLAMLKSGDAEQLKAASGILYATLTSFDPDSAAKNVGEYGGSTDDKRYVVGRALVDQSGQALYRDPEAKYMTVKNASGGEDIVQLSGGGDPVSSGGGASGGSGPVAGRTQFGWTPRARNGGDNTDAAVDNKIAGMAKSLGFGADVPFPAGTTPAQIYEALTLSEGGRGSLADTNNNRGNLRDPKTLAYRKFGDKSAGDAAGIAQVRRNLARGQNTIRTMVEGLPRGGASSAANASSGGGAKVVFTSKGGSGGSIDPDLTGDAFLAALPVGRRNLLQSIAEGRAKPPQPGSKFGQALAEDLARAYPGVDTTTFATRQQTLNAFARGTQGNTVRSLNVAIDHLGVLHDAALALESGNVPLFNQLSQRWQTATGGALPGNARAIAGIVGDEVTKAVVGSAGALADREELKKTLDTAGSPAQIKGITRAYISLMAGQAKGLQLQYEAGTGNKDFGKYLNATTRKQLGIGRSGGGSTPKPTNGWGKARVVTR